MDPYVSCELTGGLGNQFFQIMTTIAYAIRYNRRVVFPFEDILYNRTTNRPTYWNSLFGGIKDTTVYNKEHGFTNDDLIKFPYYCYEASLYKEIPLFPKTNFMLIGYFQSYKYFEKEANQILERMNIDIHQSTVLNEFSELLTGHAVSMHFRLGDYLALPNYHPIMPAKYYENALTYILSKRRKPLKVIYFCEPADTDTVNKTLDTLRHLDVTFIKAPDAIPDWKQLLLMSLCIDNIIANSTFSWWGAYLNRAADSIKCYPSLWFGPALPKDVHDLFPDSWVKINVA